MNKIHYIKIGDDCYQLTREYETETRIIPMQRIYFRFTILDTDRTLILRKGFTWDGATGAWDTDTLMRGSAEHDAKYELLRQELIPQECREIADDELKETCLMDGMNRFRAAYIHEGVEHLLLAKLAASPDHKRVERVSP